MELEVLTAVKSLMLIFWIVTPCGLLADTNISALKMEAVCSSETLVSIYKSTRCYYPKYQHQQMDYCWINIAIEIWVSHGGEYEDGCPLGCCAV
jgi:hypothetical protein